MSAAPKTATAKAGGPAPRLRPPQEARSHPQDRPAAVAAADAARPRRAAAGLRRRRRLVGLARGLAGRGRRTGSMRCRAASSAPSRPSSSPTSPSRAATMSSAAPSWRRSTSSRGDSLLGVDLQASRQRLEAIDWVAGATVERRLPDTLYVTLKERRAVAIWQNGDGIHADRPERPHRARQPHAARRRDAAAAGRSPARPSMSASCCCCSPTSRRVARQLRAAVWVGQRRWNLVLNNGVEIWLPEEDAVAALQQLAKLDGAAQAAVARVRRRRSQAAGQALSQEARSGRCVARAGVTSNET